MAAELPRCMEFNWKAGGRRGRDTLEQTGTFAYSGTDTGTFLITGKRWPTLFEVRFE
ncbi:hypothetical protein [Candidatus Poriferisocius sp.]|uniref:hypothetical protein n=1 Tax=Candidatus Poriferisocius sp. TaxID=3101276 RepID=UPI003B529AE0